MKQFTHLSAYLFLLFFVCFSSVLSVFGQIQNKEEENGEEDNYTFYPNENAEINTEDIEFIEEVEIEISCQAN